MFKVYELDVSHSVFEISVSQFSLSVDNILGPVVGHRPDEMPQIIQPDCSESSVLQLLRDSVS